MRKFKFLERCRQSRWNRNRLWRPKIQPMDSANTTPHQALPLPTMAAHNNCVQPIFSKPLKEITMSVSTKFAASALIALASVAATSAFAGNDNNYPDVKVASTLSRAAVQAEAAQALKDGNTPFGNDKQYPVLTSTSSKTRAEVRAELVAAREAGQLVREHS